MGPADHGRKGKGQEETQKEKPEPGPQGKGGRDDLEPQAAHGKRLHISEDAGA